jgi:hypothetical protein
VLALSIIGGTLAIGLLLIVHGTIFRTNWGINGASNFECPRCHNIHGQIRVPRNLLAIALGRFYVRTLRPGSRQMEPPDFKLIGC